MLREERQTLIVRAVAGRDAVPYEALQALTGASAATLRRDVDQLCEAGQLRKVRGGVAPLAVPKPLQSYFFRDEQVRHMAAKNAIARRAAALVQAPDALILFGGTTVARLAELLPRHGLTVLTDSLPVVNHLSLNSDNRIFLTGGEVLPQSGVVLNPFDDGPAYHFAASTFFLGCHAVGPAGIMDDPLPLRAAQRLRRQAQRIVVLADSSKFAASGSLVVFRLDEIDVFVTDDGLGEREHRMLVDAGVTVLVAPTGAGAETGDDGAATSAVDG
jgi:DeoR family ulaG and ulaABCDEF operon transcriptional repressor